MKGFAFSNVPQTSRKPPIFPPRYLPPSYLWSISPPQQCGSIIGCPPILLHLPGLASANKHPVTSSSSQLQRVPGRPGGASERCDLILFPSPSWRQGSAERTTVLAAAVSKVSVLCLGQLETDRLVFHLQCLSGQTNSLTNHNYHNSKCKTNKQRQKPKQ